MTERTARELDDPCEGHDFGHHPDSCDPWDALVSDIRAVDDGVAVHLATFWRGQAHARADRAAALEARVAVLEGALTEIAGELEAHWSHGEDCAAWATDDVTDEPLYDDTDMRHDACDCGISGLLRLADAALAPAAEGGPA